MMIKRKISFRGILNIKWVLASMLLTCSCTEELPIQEPTDRETVLQLSVSVEDSGFSSDSEMTPMNTRSETKPYVVTRILSNTLLVLKKVDEKDGWVVVERRDDVLDVQNEHELMLDEKLKLTDANAYYTLLPGTYQFLLLVNALVSNNIAKDVLITETFPKVTESIIPLGDFFFAKQEIKLEKTTQLDNENANRKVSLSLKRRSALLRFIVEGEKVAVPGINNTVFYEIDGDMCTGMDIFGNMVIQSMSSAPLTTEIFRSNSYMINETKCFFSEVTASAKSSPSLYTDEEERYINLTIKGIGDNSFNVYLFEGEHQIKNVPIKKNCITTILLREINKESITHMLNPSIENWDASYPPLNYVELNNKVKQ